MRSNITHAQSHPNTVARKERAVALLRGLQKRGGIGPLGNMMGLPGWRWSLAQGVIATNNKQWWITPRGLFWLECYGK
jgi:hypothetical protein